MKKITDWMEKYFVPIATKLGSQRHLCSIRDAFIGVMPLTMAGSVAVLLNVFFRDVPRTWGLDGFVEAMTPLLQINGIVNWATISILALVFVFALGYNLSASYNINPLAGGLISFASLIATIPNIDSAEKKGFINVSSYGGASGVFTAMFIGILATSIFVFFVKKKIIIKLPDSVPPAVNKAFAAMLPGIFAIYTVAIITFVINYFFGVSINELILKYIQAPLLDLSQGLGSVVIIAFLIQLLWFFGLHGFDVLAPITSGVYIPALNENIAIFEKTGDISQLPYLWTNGSFFAYVYQGGAGATLALIIAIFVASKKDGERSIAKLSAPMGVFNINEPVTFGMPIVLNPIYAIPWLIIPPICTVIAYLFTSFGVIPPVFVSVPWITPPILYAFLATGGSFMAALVSALNMLVAFLIYLPFVKLSNKMK